MYSSFFDKITGEHTVPKVQVLKELIALIRAQGETVENQSAIDKFTHYLEDHPDDAKAFLVYLIEFISRYKAIDVYTQTGLLSGRGFFTILHERIGERLIPGVGNKKQLAYMLTSIFDSEQDIEWLNSITKEQWHRLFGVFTAVDLAPDETTALRAIQQDILHAVELISYEISGLSLNEEVIKAYPEIMELNSPFIAQNQEIQTYVKAYEHYLTDGTDLALEPDPDPNAVPDPDPSIPEEDHILVMLEQCVMLLKQTHKNTYATGVSIRLTNILVRLEQKVERLEQLLLLLQPACEKKSEAFGELIYSITHGQQDSHQIRPLVRSNTELLSLRIIESASKVGETYVARDIKSQWKMFKVSAGAGVLIGVMATIKILLGKLVLPPIGKAVLNSFNYSFGFVLIYLFHFKIATKQPAMTASALASIIEPARRRKKAKLTKLSELIVDIIRTQMAAIAGNIALAMPVAFIMCYAWNRYLDMPLMSPDKAQSLLDGIDPIHSPALFYAALTGVFLFLSGVISGYYDNLAIYRNLGRRVSRLSVLLATVGKFRARRIGNYVEKNFGSIAGNFWFGVMLGSTPTLGYILGLPLDIRHIAFSSANFIQGFFWSGQPMDTAYAAYLFVGVLLIGAMNLFVSFNLALLVALKARNVKFAQWKSLLLQVAVRVLKRPFLLLLPDNRLQPDEAKLATKDAH